ncbi:general transcription factor IIH subunit 4 [Schistocerca cancellata]|uniref:general transcription factor IIH subunit 4 n=1 Tax=Schistocerca cancellata TaxID=274614 RepID=UPI00211874C4|nr:general transcription factor IIH subunit 4 [Schistocerca cancellata]
MADQNKFPKLSLQSKNLQCKNLHDYLKTLQSGTLEKLYNHPTTCLAVYRELPEIARHYVIRILFVEQPVPQAVVASWVSQAYAKEHAQVSEVLTSLHVWQEAAIPGGLPGWILNTTFKKYLKVALLGGGRPWSMSSTLEADSKPRDIPYLDSYANERWECVLHYMVGSQQQEGISADAVRILLHAGLMKRDEADGSPVITRDGFQFLLLDTASQVWYFILQYLDTVETRGLDLVDCLTFLFQLSFSTMGKDYSTEGMSEGLLVFLQHLREFGLVYQRKRKAGRFYPTRLALNLASGQSKILTEAAAEGYIVVETNYRVYAYTSSNLQVALVGLFCELLYRFPNLAVGILTRDSVRQALRSGITADQIIGFLRLHAHPRMIAAGPPTLPPTIVDQIKLWENERNRFSYTEGVLYSQFLSQADYEVVRDHAQELGVLIWSSTARRTIIVTRVGHDDVKKFWKRYSKGGG